MAKSRNQKLKLLYLLKILREKTDDEHALTMAEIIAELERYDIQAERKSIYDDFDMLREFGIDIEMQRGKNTRYFIASRDFELAELKLLVDAVQSSKFLTKQKSSSLIRKLENLVSNYEAQRLQRQVYVANRIKTMNESIYYTVDTIHDAMMGNSQITFHYFEWNSSKQKVWRHDGKRYRVSPWRLMWDDENYYLVAYEEESDQIKHYRVDKMERINIVKEQRLGAEQFKNFDTGIYSQKVFGMYRGREEQVTLRCENGLANVMVDRFGQDVVMYPVDDEHFEISVRVMISPLFLSWLLNFGSRIKVISPQSVVDDYVIVLKEALSRY